MAAADPQARIETLERALHWAQLTIQKKEGEIQQLLERLRTQRVGFLGPASETLSDLQLELLVEQEPSTTREEVEAESRREPITEPRERKPHPGRNPLPDNLPRIEEVIPCEAHCRCCGGATAVIGYDTSEVLFALTTTNVYFGSKLIAKGSYSTAWTDKVEPPCRIAGGRNRIVRPIVEGELGSWRARWRGSRWESAFVPPRICWRKRNLKNLN